MGGEGSAHTSNGYRVMDATGQKSVHVKAFPGWARSVRSGSVKTEDNVSTVN